MRQNTSFDIYQLGSACGRFDGSNRSQAAAEFLFETPLQLHPNFWITSRLGYGTIQRALASPVATFEARDETWPADSSVVVRKQQRFSAAVHAIRLAAGVAWEPVDGLRLGIAPSLAVALGSSQETTDEVLEPSYARFFVNDSAQHTCGDPTQVSFRRLVPGIDLQIGAVIPFGYRLALHPEVRGLLEFGSIASNVSWHEIGLQASIGLSFDLSTERHRPEQLAASTKPESIQMSHPDTPTMRHPVRTKPPIRAMITARAIDGSGGEQEDPTIEIEESPWMESVPMIPYVFFDSSSAEIPERYVRLPDRAHAANFHVDSLVDITPLDIHWQNLNVVGERMQADPTCTLTLVGTASADEVQNGEAERLGLARAQAVADYLATTWHVPPQRIVMQFESRTASASPEQTHEGVVENRRVEFRFSNETLAQPVTIRRVATIASPPAVRFMPRAILDTSFSKLAGWYVTVEQGSKELLRFSGGGEKGTFDQVKRWSLGDMRVNRDLTPIRYRVVIRDTDGDTASASGTFKIVERKRQRVPGMSDRPSAVAEFNLVGFNYNSSELQPQHSAQLLAIARLIGPATTVTVAGYTDRVGDPDRNRQLSLDRARAVVAVLRSIKEHNGEAMTEKVAVLGLGNERELFNNNLPEGRLLSRMVRITLQTP
ncbi:MAG TPA: OmpA family protein [Candidatus Kapabacteria bacterium]|nr:OmpA family protein [Candidatus Kapabacteria bacterium]